MTPAWDLLIRGGTLIDPAQSISAKRDVAFRGGKVAAVAATLTGDANEVIDATGSSTSTPTSITGWRPAGTPTRRRSPTA